MVADGQVNALGTYQTHDTCDLPSRASGRHAAANTESPNPETLNLNPKGSIAFNWTIDRQGQSPYYPEPPTANILRAPTSERRADPKDIEEVDDLQDLHGSLQKKK